ncbi:MAG: LLM class flavin-dependent oxidoreductase [Acetobacteraceae bacterium]
MQAEQGCLDAILFGPHPWGAALSASGWCRACSLTRWPLIAALAATGRHIGLGAAVGLDRAEPFNIARSFAGSDRLTGGRTLWVTGLSGPGERAENFAHAAPLSLAQRYDRAAECIAVAKKLWDSWEDGAVVLDKPAGLFSDPDKVHRINHAGPYFSVRGR